MTVWDFTSAHPVWAAVLLLIFMTGLRRLLALATTLARQPYLFYRHIADGRRMARHRAAVRALYEEFGTTSPVRASLAHEFEAVDESFGDVYRKVA